MKKLLKHGVLVSAFVVLLMLAGGRARATTDITWKTIATSSSDSDVVTNGKFVQAYYEGAGNANTPETVNGVTFTSSGGAPGGSANSAGISTTSPDNINTYNGYTSASIGSASYTAILSGGWSTGNPPYTTPITLTLTGLTSGDSYEFQWWANDSRGPSSTKLVTASAGIGDTVTISAAGNGASPYAGQFAIGDFTADNTGTEVITFTGNPDLFNAQSPPMNFATWASRKPSVVALIGLGGLLLQWSRRRRSQQAV